MSVFQQSLYNSAVMIQEDRIKDKWQVAADRWAMWKGGTQYSTRLAVLVDRTVLPLALQMLLCAFVSFDLFIMLNWHNPVLDYYFYSYSVKKVYGDNLDNK